MHLIIGTKNIQTFQNDNRFDPVFPSSNKTSLSHWKGKPIIPLEEWIEIRDTLCALDYFPDDFDQMLTYIQEDKLEKREREARTGRHNGIQTTWS